jgi:transketolase N-terminal domain/subunit
MQRWEYLYVQAYFALDNGALHLSQLNFQNLKDWKKAPAPMEFLNRYGAQGWGLVSVEGHEFYFKRPTQ